MRETPFTAVIATSSGARWGQRTPTSPPRITARFISSRGIELRKPSGRRGLTCCSTMRRMQVRMTGGEALAQQLVREGVRQIFGVPGVQLDFAVDGLAKMSNKIAYWNTRHEQSTSYMADGYARASGQIGVCMVVPGPGLLNALAGIVTAYACSSRVLCIAGQIPSTAIGRGLGMLHEIPDQSRILGALTKWSRCATSPAEVPGLVHEAIRQLRSGRPQPVGLEIPPDVLQAQAGVTLL